MSGFHITMNWRTGESTWDPSMRNSLALFYARMVKEFECVVEKTKFPLTTYEAIGVRVTMEHYGQEKIHYYPIINELIGTDKTKKVGTGLG